MATDDVQITDASAQLVAVATDVITTLNGGDISANSPQTEAQRVKVGWGGDGTFRDVDTGFGLPTQTANGANVAQGATTDAEATGTTNGSVIALLKRIRTLLAGGLPGSLGGAGGLQVEVLTLPALPSGANTIGTVNVNNMPAAQVSTDAMGVAPLAEVSLAGATPYKLNSAATTNATNVKASAGKVFFMAVMNTNAAVRYIKFYNKASAPTVGSDTPVLTLPIPGNTAGSGFTLALPMPIKFTTGLSFALTTGATDADTGAVAANEIIVNLGWV